MSEAEAPQETTQEPGRFTSIAAARYGSRFVGEVPEAQADEPATEEPVEVGEPLEAESAEPEAEATEEVIQSLSELTEAQEWDPEWVNTLRVPVKVDGADTDASIEDLVRSYQTQEAANARLEQSKAAKEEARQLREAVATKAQENVAVFGKLIQAAEQKLAGDAQSADMESLRQNDPAEWAAKTQEFQQRAADLQGLRAQALAEYQKAVAETQQQTQVQHQERLRVEQAALLEALPTWSDPEVAQAEQQALVSHLTARGFAEEDVLGASDHRLILLALDAMKYRESQKATDAARKKVARVPKVLKPGAPKSPDQRSSEKLEALRRKARKSGSRADALALFRAKRAQDA